MVHLTMHLVAKTTERIVRILVNNGLERKWMEEIMEKIKTPSQRKKRKTSGVRLGVEI